MGSYQRSSSKHRPNPVKANWTPENHEMFVDLCLEQVALGNRPGTHFNKIGWRNILDAFHTLTGLNYDKTQLKNHWDMTKKHWKCWQKLISTETMKWNPEMRTFGASDLEWNDYIKENPDAAPYRHRELPFADKLDTIFAGTEDSVLLHTPSSHRRNLNSPASEPAPRRRKHNNYARENVPPARVRNHLFGSPVDEPIVVRPEFNVDRYFDTVESRSVITVQSPPPKLSYSIEECIKSLDSIEELEQGSDLYLFALDIFLNKDYREIFLNLKKSSTKIAWLQRLQSGGQPLSSQ